MGGDKENKERVSSSVCHKHLIRPCLTSFPTFMNTTKQFDNQLKYIHKVQGKTGKVTRAGKLYI